MAYQSLSKYQKTTNYSQRDIDQKFNLIEFNRIFEQNNLALENKDTIKVTQEPKCPNKSQQSIFIIIIFIILIIGIILLLINNFILDKES